MKSTVEAEGSGMRSLVGILVAVAGIVAGAASVAARLPEPSAARVQPAAWEAPGSPRAEPAVIQAPPSDVVGCDA